MLGFALFGQGCVAQQTALPQAAASRSAPLVTVAQAPEGGAEEAGAEAYYRFMRSLLAEQKGDYQAAIHWQKDALQYDPASVPMRNHLAALYVKRGDFRNAIKAAEDVLVLDPKSLHAHLLWRPYQACTIFPRPNAFPWCD
jgi:tetratricopeptide (TPR) repeat protein